MIVRRLWWAGGGLLVLAIVVLSLAPPPPIPGPTIPFGDKWGHLLSYAVLMWWFAQLAGTTRARLGWVIAFSALGALLEGLQALTATRQAEGLDWLADMLGLAFGWGVATTPLGQMLRSLERRWP